MKPMATMVRTVSIALMGASVALGAHSIAFAAGDTNFNNRIYLGGGIGVSELEPESNNPSLTVSETASNGFNLTLGYDVSRWLSAEAYIGQLGNAQIDFLGTDVGPVDYTVFGVSAIAYLLNSQSGSFKSDSEQGMFRREGLSLYGRMGLGALFNDTVVDYNRDHAVHLAVGLGLEYGFKNSFAVRGEYAAFDSDAQYASINLLKRLGDNNDAAPLAAAGEKSLSLAEVAPFIYFGFDEYKLSATAKSELKKYAAKLAKSEEYFVVEGHADEQGPEGYNMALSKRRAIEVYEYLLAQGIASKRIATRGYGESRPASTNETQAGRAKNRRVEFVTQ